MDDQSILHRIQHLVDEEHRLDGKHDHSPRREFGKDPDQAKVRDPKTVEGYEQ